MFLQLLNIFCLFFISRVLCIGAKDMNTRIYGVQKFENLMIYSLGGHTDSIVNSFLEHNSLDVSFFQWLGELDFGQILKFWNFLKKYNSCEHLHWTF